MRLRIVSLSRNPTRLQLPTCLTSSLNSFYTFSQNVDQIHISINKWHLKNNMKVTRIIWKSFLRTKLHDILIVQTGGSLFKRLDAAISIRAANA